ncbi:MAG TPA: EF-P lysine aminoacylase EpmA [Steroidobacteraceae bacterium]|nr:EF-P lysine aminoacylase EpmA [Steroidobacteraceae bacterium]
MQWRPGAGMETLRRRAALLECARGFFRERGVMEVETPVVLSHTVTDVQIESLRLDAASGARWLQTSPEYPMKRLLAAGSGDIFQVCHVFRAGEHSRLHNPEFTMIEWYRLGMDLLQVMDETAALAAKLFDTGGNPAGPTEHISYAAAFRQALDCDPLTATDAQLAALAGRHGLVDSSLATATRDELLEFLVATRVGPELGRGRLTCLHHFPASQAALAQLDASDPRTALRFELYAEGVELANGYVELASSSEQRARFVADQAERIRRGLTGPALDERLIAALDAGLPACAGVALGFDRAAMLALGAASIDEVMAFAWDRA